MKKNTSIKLIAFIIMIGIIASFLAPPIMYILEK